MTAFQVLDADNPADLTAWLEMWHRWPHREVFAHPSYLKLYSDGRSRAMCAMWRSAESCVLHPFLLRDVATEAFWNGSVSETFDITSAYGYGGPFFWGAEDKYTVARSLWPEFRRWATDNRIVCEFVRFSLFAETILPYEGDKWKIADHVVRCLDPEEPVLWMDFEHKVRKNVKKALRAGVRIEVDEQGDCLSEFLGIYQHTMERRRALDFYCFPREYFVNLRRNLPGNFVYFHAILDSVIISTELVLISEQSVYSFLGGTSEDAFAMRPNDLLKFEIMKWAKARGKRHFVLGGGYEAADGIYRYKLSFAPKGTKSYFLGGQVFSTERYSELIRARDRFERECGRVWQPSPGFFPGYRSYKHRIPLKTQRVSPAGGIEQQLRRLVCQWRCWNSTRPREVFRVLETTKQWVAFI